MINIWISVIIPVYNDEKHIEIAIKSIIDQTIFENIELIIVDDGSTDRTQDIIRRYTDGIHIKYIKQENSGQGVARNNGLLKAKGKYIYFLDSDDWIEEKCLESCYLCLEKNKSDIVTFNSKTYREIAYSNIMEYSNRNFLIYNNYLCEDYLKISLENNMLYTPTWLYVYRKDFLIENNIKFKSVLYEDTIMLLQICRLNPIISYINQCLHCRKVRENSSMTKKVKSERHFWGAYECFEEAYITFLFYKYSNPKLADYLREFTTKGIITFFSISRKMPMSIDKLRLKLYTLKLIFIRKEYWKIKIFVFWLIS